MNQNERGTPILEWSSSYVAALTEDCLTWDDVSIVPHDPEDLDEGEESVVFLHLDGKEVRDINFQIRVEAEIFAEVADGLALSRNADAGD